MPPITLDLEKNPSSTEVTTIYHAKGKLSLETVNAFVQQLRPDGSSKLVLDLSGAIGLVLALTALAAAALAPQAKAVVMVAGLHNMLPIYATVEEATNGKKG